MYVGRPACDRARRAYPDFEPQLAAALQGGDVACLLLDCDGSLAKSSKDALGRLIAFAQQQGVAVLLPEAELAARSGADGAHITVESRAGDEDDDDRSQALMAALKRLKPDGIVGAGRLRTRHDAMSAAELDVEYVMFGEPGADGGRPPHAAIRERVEWWAEVFNLPCVAYADDSAQAAELARAGADFVAMGAGVWQHAEGPQSAVSEAMAALALARAEARIEREAQANGAGL
jgi:thiamine-phosphate pyrophosphorylase